MYFLITMGPRYNLISDFMICLALLFLLRILWLFGVFVLPYEFSLYHLNETNLIMVYWLFNVAKLCLKYFIENFYIYVHQENCSRILSLSPPPILSFCHVLFQFWSPFKTGFTEWVGSIPYLSILFKSLWNVAVCSLFGGKHKNFIERKVNWNLSKA
jgi:hypothetical protein